LGAENTPAPRPIDPPEGFRPFEIGDGQKREIFRGKVVGLATGILPPQDPIPLPDPLRTFVGVPLGLLEIDEALLGRQRRPVEAG
jgi:hypothetical protein